MNTITVITSRSIIPKLKTTVRMIIVNIVTPADVRVTAVSFVIPIKARHLNKTYSDVL